MLGKDLPDIYMITYDDFGNVETLVSKVEKQLKNNIKLVQLRIKNEQSENYARYADELFKLCNAYSARLVLNHPLNTIPKVDCFGVHMTSEALMQTQGIPGHIKNKYTVSCPVHNLQELDKANELGVDFAILTPIKKSITYPKVQAVGWTESEIFIKRAKMPLYAAGGMGMNDLHQAKDSGFVGIACLGTLWK
jgi:thiamine-phosphate pyrophosphorylase